MKRSTTPKALYNFARKQKLKDSTSTRDLNDSLDQLDAPQNPPRPSKKLHARTQSCPSITEPHQLASPPLQQTQRSLLDSSPREKPTHRYCQSQASLDCRSGVTGVSIESLSVAVYRRGGKGLKKSGKGRMAVLRGEEWGRARLEQQMKSYELREELRELAQRSSGITVKQQILENLLVKFEEELVPPLLMQ